MTSDQVVLPMGVRAPRSVLLMPLFYRFSAPLARIEATIGVLNMVAIHDSQQFTYDLIIILRSLLGTGGVNVLGTYNLVSSGRIVSTEPAIALQWQKETEGLSRVIQKHSGIECVIRGEPQTDRLSLNRGATRICDKFQIVLDQHNPQKTLQLAINAIYAHPYLSPFANDAPTIRDRATLPSGGVAPARAILTSPRSVYQESIF